MGAGYLAQHGRDHVAFGVGGGRAGVHVDRQTMAVVGQHLAAKAQLRGRRAALAMRPALWIGRGGARAVPTLVSGLSENCSTGWHTLWSHGSGIEIAQLHGAEQGYVVAVGSSHPLELLAIGAAASSEIRLFFFLFSWHARMGEIGLGAA